MSLDRKPVQARLSDETYDALALIATVKGKELGEVLRELGGDSSGEGACLETKQSARCAR